MNRKAKEKTPKIEESIEEEEHARGGMEVGAEAHCDVLPETAHMRPAKSKNENQKSVASIRPHTRFMMCPSLAASARLNIDSAAAWSPRSPRRN
jgi:hypothetical protein